MVHIPTARKKEVAHRVDGGVTVREYPAAPPEEQTTTEAA